MLHGKAIIDLHNTRTHRDERIVHDNMLTNWIRDVVKPRSIYLLGRPSIDTLTASDIFRGLMMFRNQLSNDPDDYLFPSPNINPCVAHADNTAYSGTDATRGSFNESQSSWVDGTITSVWDFTQEQGNGTIASLGLCSLGFAQAGNGSKNPVQKYERGTYQRIFGNYRSTISGSASVGWRFYDGTRGTAFVITVNSGVVNLVEVPAHWSKINPIIGGHTTTLTFYTPSNTVVETYDLSSAIGTSDPYGFVSDDGKFYVFSRSWSSGTTKTIVVFDLAARTYTTQTVTNNTGVSIAPSQPFLGMQKFVIHEGIMYVPTSGGLVYINLSDNTDCGIVKAPNGVDDISISAITPTKFGNMVLVSSRGDFLTNQSDMGNVYIVHKGESWWFGWGEINMVAYQSTNGILQAGQSVSKILFAQGGLAANSSNNYGDSWMEVPCLTTKNNLESAVTKTADMTMRVTYTVTDQAE